jgi:hypothetical protein
MQIFEAYTLQQLIISLEKRSTEIHREENRLRFSNSVILRVPLCFTYFQGSHFDAI